MMFGLNLAGAGVSVITIPIMLAIAGVQAYGHLILVQSLALTAFTICSFQYWQGMLVALPGHKIEAAVLKRSVWTSLRYELLGISIVVLGAIVLGAIGLPQTAEFDTLQLLLLALSAVFPVIGTHTAYFRLVNRYNVLMLAGFTANLLKLLCLVGVSHYAPTVTNMVLAFSIPEFVRCALLFYLIYRWNDGIEGTLDGGTIDRVKVRRAGRWSTLQAIADLPVNQVDRIIIGFTLPGASLGVFAILKRIYSLVNMATSPFYSTSIPEFAAKANAGDIKGAFELWRRTMKMLFSVTAVVALACIVSKGIWMPLVFPVLQPYNIEFIIVLVTAVAAGTFITTHSLYWALGHLRQTTIIAVGSNACYLLVLAAFTWLGGLTGSVLAFLVHVLLVAGLKIILLKRVKKTNI
ncbi:lipopolysaccharide biosynthesis protein [Pseudoduganella lutea]|uniref:Oligosaccharide flippase family protein n=1 Tax=Pseudoduganella lutea TaxID=321985 RepID=A0A4P6KV34_9BURK|nr:hypothetical protein [Pseudoduganella lutea]QBE62525.1 hypothetical protein EWM63_05680 [Pseudoduganella lutea]